MCLSSLQRENVHRKMLQGGCGNSFKGIDLLFLVFSIFAKIHLRKHLRHLSFPSSCFLVCPPTLRKKCAFAYPACHSSLPWDIQTSRWPSGPGASKPPLNQRTTVDFMSFLDLHIFQLGQNMASEMDIFILVGYLVYIYIVQWSNGFLIKPHHLFQPLFSKNTCF